MILVGQYDSPFVRRVAIALNYFGMEFERHVLSTFQNLDEMLAINPLGKVPATSSLRPLLPCHLNRSMQHKR